MRPPPTKYARSGDARIAYQVVGSGLRFVDRDVHALRGVPGEWRVYAVEP